MSSVTRREFLHGWRLWVTEWKLHFEGAIKASRGVSIVSSDGIINSLRAE